MCVRTRARACVCEQDLALKDLQVLICPKIPVNQPTNQPVSFTIMAIENSVHKYWNKDKVHFFYFRGQ